MKNNDFLLSLTKGLLSDSFKTHRRNIEYIRFPASLVDKFKNSIKANILYFASRWGWHRPAIVSNANLSFILKNIDRFEEFYELLEDAPSKNLLIELLKFRILGQRHVKLPLNNDEYQKNIRLIAGAVIKADSIGRSGQLRINQYNWPVSNGKICLHANPLNIMNTFILEQYAYRKAEVIEPEIGDVIIDGGACWGEASLYFADKVGSEGRVYGFEFDQTNLRTMRINCDLNEILNRRIKIVEKALWHESERKIEYASMGPGTNILSRDYGAAVLSVNRKLFAETISIDDFVEREGISKIDFIKMDIEGSERNALRGAMKTLRAHRPKLAISIYHLEDDFIQIPAFLNGLALGYKFFIDHFTFYREETVLFAKCFA